MLIQREQAHERTRGSIGSRSDSVHGSPVLFFHFAYDCNCSCGMSRSTNSITRGSDPLKGGCGDVQQSAAYEKTIKGIAIELVKGKGNTFFVIYGKRY